MSIGASGRIVIEVEPRVKRDLYAVLAEEGTTLKEWFVRHAAQYVRDSRQLRLELSVTDGETGK
jgi:hypothetical protein